MPPRGCHAWSGGEAVWRAVGDAVDSLAFSHERLCCRRRYRHLPFTSERPMRDRVEDEVSGHLEGEVEGYRVSPECTVAR